MGNIWTRPEKAPLRKRLKEIGEEVLRRDGWSVERIPGGGKSSVRRIRKGAVSRTVSIRTTQNTWIAFPRNSADTGWVTLSDVDAVVAVSVDDEHAPKNALVHLIEGDEMRDRFDRAYRARKAAGHSIPIGRGVWVALYDEERETPASFVGAGAGLSHPPIATVPLMAGEATRIRSVVGTPPSGNPPVNSVSATHQPEEEPLSLTEAKRRLALTFGVTPENIKIVVEA
jgi:hypothetical protein